MLNQARTTFVIFKELHFVIFKENETVIQDLKIRNLTNKNIWDIL